MKNRLDIAIVNNDEGVKAAAIDAAEASLTENKSELKGFKGICKKIWKYGIGRDYYRQKEIAKTKKQILESGNIYVAEQGSQADHDEAMSAIVDRFTSEYDGMVHTEAGERKDVLDENNPEQKELKENITKLIKDYAAGNIDEKIFQEEKIRIFQEASASDKPTLERSGMYADNMLTIAKQLKDSVEHGQKLEEMDLEFNIIVGKAKAGVRTEASYNKIDTLVDKISSTKVGSLVNEFTVAAALSLSYFALKNVSRRLASSKLFALASFGGTVALSSGIAAVREGKLIEDERRQHSRELAQGKTFSNDKKIAPRRAEMEKFRYDTASANELKGKLEASLYEKDGSVKELSSEELALALSNLAEIEARIAMSDRRKIDLVSYSDIKKVEQERFALDVCRAKAKVDLNNFLSKKKDLKLPLGDNFDDSLNRLSVLMEEKLLQDGGGIEEIDRTFKKMKRGKMCRKAIDTATIGLVFGATFQEVRSIFSDELQGLFDKQGSKSVTAAKGLYDTVKHWFTGGTPRLGGPLHEEIVNGGHFKLPEGASLVAGANGTYNLMHGEDVIASDIKFNPNGSLTEEAKNILAQHNVLHTENVVNTTVESMTPGTRPDDIIDKHPELFHKVNRKMWYDNDTKVFDKNELKTWWGGENNTGINKDGNYVFNVKHMMPGGSYHGNQSVNAQELIKGGSLKMVFSLSRETQNMVCEVQVDNQGNFTIDKDSEMGKLLFSSENGKAKFLAKFAEVVQSMGQNEDGSEKIRVLSTYVGEGIKGTAPIQNIEQIQNILTELDLPDDRLVDLPLFLPVVPRTPLEKTYNTVPYGDNYFSSGGDENYRKNRSETLLNDSEAKLDHYKEAESYIEKFDDDYKKEVEELSNQAGPMEKSTKLTICIPAAGHQEGKNIYKTLENYTHQTADPSEYEICILVNQPDKDDKGKIIKPDNTLAEIKRFQADHPNIKVRVMNKTLPIENAKIGYVRKLLNDSVLYRHHQRGKDVADLIMVSNDADNEGISPEYVKNFIDKFATNKKADAMLGQLDWDPAAYVKHPVIHVATRLFQYLDAFQRQKTGFVGSSGANFAFRSSIYSAIGGYGKDETLAEDVALGRAIRYARKRVDAIAFADSKSRLYTSSRRAIDAWKSGLVPFEQWNKGFSAFDDKIRSFEIDKEETEINFDSKEYLEKLKKELEYAITITINTYEGYIKQGEDSEDYRRSINLLGIKYKKVDGQVVIEDMSNLVSTLKEYQQVGIKLRDYKSGKISYEEFKKSVPEPEKKPAKPKSKLEPEKKSEPEKKPEPKLKPEIKPKPEKAAIKKEEIDLSTLTLDKLYEQISNRDDKNKPLIIKGWENKKLKLDKERLVLLLEYINQARAVKGVFDDMKVDSVLSYEKVKNLSRAKKESLTPGAKLDLARAKYKTNFNKVKL